MGKYRGTEVRPQWQMMHPLKADRVRTEVHPQWQMYSLKAERVRFLLNGNKFFKGVTMAVSRARYKDLGVLLDAVTAALRPHVTLPSAITRFYRVDGSRIDTIDCFADGDIVLSCTQYNNYKPLDYQVNSNFKRLISSVNRWNDLRIEPCEKMVPDSKTYTIRTFFCSLEPMMKDDPTPIYAPYARVQPTSKNFGEVRVQPTSNNFGEFPEFPFWELNVLRSLLPHPNIVDLFYLFDGERFLVVGKTWLDTDAESVIRKQGPLSEADVRTVARGTVAGILHMHSLQIVHRDIRPANLMLQVQPDGSPLIDTVKIGNFASSAFFRGSKLTRCCGTIDYAAPEMTSGKGYDLKADCWSLGVTLFFLLYGKLPFGDQANNKKVIISIDKEPLAMQMLHKLLQRDPAERATIEQIAQHAWLQALHL